MAKEYMRFVNIDEFSGRLDDIIKNCPDALKKILKFIGLEALKLTRHNTPVVTGNLRRNWFLGAPQIDKDGAKIEISNNTEYGYVVEHGKKTGSKGYFPGRFMLRRSLDEVELNKKTIVERMIEKFAKRGKL